MSIMSDYHTEHAFRYATRKPTKKAYSIGNRIRDKQYNEAAEGMKKVKTRRWLEDMALKLKEAQDNGVQIFAPFRCDKTNLNAPLNCNKPSQSTLKSEDKPYQQPSVFVDVPEPTPNPCEYEKQSGKVYRKRMKGTVRLCVGCGDPTDDPRESHCTFCGALENVN